MKSLPCQLRLLHHLLVLLQEFQFQRHSLIHDESSFLQRHHYSTAELRKVMLSLRKPVPEMGRSIADETILARKTWRSASEHPRIH